MKRSGYSSSHKQQQRGHVEEEESFDFDDRVFMVEEDVDPSNFDELAFTMSPSRNDDDDDEDLSMTKKSCSTSNRSDECLVSFDQQQRHRLIKRSNKDTPVAAAAAGTGGFRSPPPGGPRGGGAGASRRPNVSRQRRPNMTTTRPTATAAATTTTSYYDDEFEERTDIEAYDNDFLEYEMALGKSPYWNISCMNRSFDENFKNFQKGVNRNHSVIHVPTNVYKQDLDINMTAYWTEALDEQFRRNYDNDQELFWQYFCASNGLFRRYPGAYWTIKQSQDFFDCRLQSWYLMAAASPKDVLILLDVSGSMTGSRLNIAKKLIEGILDTLSDNDFFNILTFSKKVSTSIIIDLSIIIIKLKIKLKLFE